MPTSPDGSRGRTSGSGARKPRSVLWFLLGFVLFTIGVVLVARNYSNNPGMLNTGLVLMGLGGLVVVINSFRRDRTRQNGHSNNTA